MKTFTVLKKNRKYFACQMDNGRKFKLFIDENSEKLALNTHTLDLEDCSIKSNYGVDFIYRLKGDPIVQKEAGICTLNAPYNTELVKQCRAMGGKWDARQSVWIFSGLIADEVEELEAKYTMNLTAVELTCIEEDGTAGHCEPVTVAGIVLARAYGRDSGAEISDGISVLKGKFISSGSRANWSTRCSENTVVRLHIPQALIEEIDTKIWDVKLL